MDVAILQSSHLGAASIATLTHVTAYAVTTSRNWIISRTPRATGFLSEYLSYGMLSII